MKNKHTSPWAWIPTLYFAQGLPYVAVMTISVIMYKRLGISNTELAVHILLHLNIVSAFFKKRFPNRTLRMVLYVFLLMLLLITIVPWFYMFH